ncbi:unnamed protein product [Rotaria magnacalcarata]|uniref:Uncharacterized protein n=2 Tax=Rotaria magnacalcarata TaxID=392030 RepID=A0A819WB26_9BILA|nr:unnamed protein product [Rotaria magnacalcarata]CAF2113084.1 unnamed protein product [Rotaria magnacalcarata]CAF4123945.1 unnamed protein product [Rotaria magnacalcarata]CAF4353154.1 unnamed protein product [Rotaria magnacalcarata]
MMILSSDEKQLLYRIQTSTSDIDAIILVDNPAYNIVANIEGMWADKTFNLTFPVYDYELNAWTDGTLNRPTHSIDVEYAIAFNNQYLHSKRKWYSHSVYVYRIITKALLVRFGIRSRWFNWSPIKYDVKIYSDIVPDVVYFLLLTVMEQRGLSKELSLL